MKCELTKSIGFNLIPVQAESLENQAKSIEEQADDDSQLTDFIEYSRDFISLFKKFIFKDKARAQNRNKNQTSDYLASHFEKINIKEKWLKSWTREEFYPWLNNNERKKEYPLCKVSYLKDRLNNFFEEWDDIIKSLEKAKQSSKDNFKRKSELALLISRFSKKQVFPFIKDFVYYSKSKENNKLKNELENKLRKIETSLLFLKNKYLPSQSSGLALTKASFNFYTVNKRPLNYDEEIEKLKKAKNSANSGYEHIKPVFHQMIKQWLKGTTDHSTLSSVDSKNQLSKETKNYERSNIIKDMGISDSADLKKLSLEQSYDLIKLYKAKAKSAFKEDMDKIPEGQGKRLKPDCSSSSSLLSSYTMKSSKKESAPQVLNYDEIKKKHPLFASSEEEYNKFVEKTQEIQNLNKKLQKEKQKGQSFISKLKQKIETLKKQRGKFFQYSAGQYKSLCENFKKIAKKYGQIKSRLNNIERAKAESQLLNFWAVILEEQEKHYLLLIHRSKAREAEERIKQNSLKNSDKKLYIFSSLTLRALDKLCFGVDSSFLREIKTELPDYKSIDGKFSFKRENSEELDEKQLVEFYQKTLKSDYANRVLDKGLMGKLKENCILDKKFSSQHEFCFALERACYFKESHFINNEIKNALLQLDESCLFEISSFDLQSHDKEIKIKPHTKLWNSFWMESNKSEGYPTRLNPEISVLWRRKIDSKLKFFDPKLGKRNRYFKSQYNLRATLTLNAGAEKADLSFKPIEDVQKTVKDFNKVFYESQRGKKLFYYGVDRGTKEQASLCMIKEDSKNEKGFSYAPIKTYRLKEEQYDHGDKAVKNLSYFMKEDNLFEKKETPTLDLTTAKLINGKIVENGDILTYLKFKELCAKRDLFNNKAQIAETRIFECDGKLCVKISNKGRIENKEIYHFREEFKKILPIEYIQNKLQKYLNSLNSQYSQSIVLDKINNLRSALSANITGILAFLHKQNNGLIILEQGQKQKKREESIAGSLEWALYRKFQTEGLVPPQLKEVDLLVKSGENQLINFGLIYFVDPEDTSQLCPECGKTNENKEEFKKRKKEGWFKCEKCGFDTKKSESLDNSDKLAAFNICKKGRKAFKTAKNQGIKLKNIKKLANLCLYVKM